MNVGLSTSEIRAQFIEYYQGEGFRKLPTASMIHPAIPMSFVMSAGLIQVETSLEQIQANATEQRFVLVQDCFRHFDLERVGSDSSHLSLFEMPGAFIFGENVKRDTIEQMWALATEVFKIDPQRLWVSYFQGGDLKGNRLLPDTETYETWRELGVNPQQLLGWGIEDNYWRQNPSLMGGGEHAQKCGSNTELFYDFGPRPECSKDCNPQCRCGRFLEFANSLFIDSEVEEGTGKVVPLVSPFTETVIGTERVATILQGVDSVFGIAEYRAMIALVQSYERAENVSLAMVMESEQIIVDHLKALCFLVGYGAPPPGKKGRERIIKLLIRRVIARLELLKIGVEDCLPGLVFKTAEHFQNGQDIVTRNTTAEQVLVYFNQELGRFRKTIERGYRQLDKISTIPGEVDSIESRILDLEKSWGMPLPLIQHYLETEEINIDWDKYQDTLQDWKSRCLLSE